MSQVMIGLNGYRQDMLSIVDTVHIMYRDNTNKEPCNLGVGHFSHSAMLRETWLSPCLRSKGHSVTVTCNDDPPISRGPENTIA